MAVALKMGSYGLGPDDDSGLQHDSMASLANTEAVPLQIPFPLFFRNLAIHEHAPIKSLFFRYDDAKKALKTLSRVIHVFISLL